jgi:hypothetical protein
LGFVRTKRTGLDGVERIVFIGYIAETVYEGDEVTIKAHAPEKLITDRPAPPFAAPMNERVTAPKVFDFWWKQLDYVFELPDPRSFPLLPGSLGAEDDRIVRRYIRVAGDLAQSGVLNAQDGFGVHMSQGPVGPMEIEQWFSQTDLQVGFAGFLRQCDSVKERAHFARVRSILWVAAEAVQDAARGERLRQLAAWRAAVNALHKKSLNQLLRDKLASDEGLRAFEFQEQETPEKLLSLYNNDDLLHWEKRGGVVGKWEADDYIESDRRLAYLDAARALAHVYVGFGELARRALGAA